MACGRWHFHAGYDCRLAVADDFLELDLVRLVLRYTTRTAVSTWPSTLQRTRRTEKSIEELVGKRRSGLTQVRDGVCGHCMSVTREDGKDGRSGRPAGCGRGQSWASVGPHRATARHVSRSRADTRSLLSGRFRRAVAFSPPPAFRSQLPSRISARRFCLTHLDNDKYDAHSNSSTD